MRMTTEEKKVLFKGLEVQAQKLISNEESMDNIYRGVVELLDKNIPYYNWTGFYMIENNQLVLGHYIGKPTDHTTIQIGEGICGQAAERKETYIVEDVTKESNYLACSFETAAEIVVPIMKGDVVLGEIDIDSDVLGAFDEDDQWLLESIAAMIAERL